MIRWIWALVSAPEFFQYGMLVWYACAITRQGFAGNWWNVLYWTSAFTINIAVTFGMRGK